MWLPDCLVWSVEVYWGRLLGLLFLRISTAVTSFMHTWHHLWHHWSHMTPNVTSWHKINRVSLKLLWIELQLYPFSVLMTYIYILLHKTCFEWVDIFHSYLWNFFSYWLVERQGLSDFEQKWSGVYAIRKLTLCSYLSLKLWRDDWQLWSCWTL